MGEDLFFAINEKFDESAAFSMSRDFDSSRDIQNLVALSNSSRVTFYTIDAAGLRVGGSSSVEQEYSGVSAFVDSQHVHTSEPGVSVNTGYPLQHCSSPLLSMTASSPPVRT